MTFIDLLVLSISEVETKSKGGKEQEKEKEKFALVADGVPILLDRRLTIQQA